MVRTKATAVDLVTATDRAAEARILDILAAATPTFGILAEESGARAGDGGRWIVDPLDGTTNFAHGIPHCAVAIGLELDERLAVGVVHDPLRGETFSAVRGQGARLDGVPIRVSETDELADALLATGFGPDHRERPERYVRPLAALLGRCRCIRRGGSAALDLAYVAAGRLEGFWEANLRAWDTAAGRLLVEEAGGKVSSFTGDPHDLHGDQTCASNGHLHTALVEVLGVTAS